MKHFLTLLFFLLSIGTNAQTTPSITFKGSVFARNDSSALLSPLVINKRTGYGFFGTPGASFSVSGLQTDTFTVTSGGYELRQICFKDSAAKLTYNVRLGLMPKVVTLQAVAIYPTKDLRTVKDERTQLGVRYEYQTETLLQAASSPITALYERFSKYEKSKQLVAQLENEDRKKDVLKDLFRIYVKADIIDLSEEQFDEFIIFLNLPEDYLKSASDLDLALLIQARYEQFRSIHQIHRNNQR
ncbi:MAG: hypothetical protein ACRCYO_15485 [Bacteroidia bacterium]